MNRLKRKAWCTLTAAVMVLAVMFVAGVSFGAFTVTASAEEEGTCAHSRYENGICTCGAYQAAQLEEGYYQIGNAGQLCWFAEYVNESNKTANAMLTADIDMKDVTWTTICETGLYHEAYGDDLGYSGTFDGNGHVISNLTVTSSTSMNASVGLFGTVSGTIKNLGMETFKLDIGNKDMDMRAGAIVGQLITLDGKVSNCYVNGATIETNNRVAGGIAGCVYDGTVENCYVVKATIEAYRWGCVAGDVCGDGSNGNGTDRPGSVVNCFTDGSVITSTQKGAASVNGGEAEVTAERFASGEIAYLLNNSSSEDVVWYQTIDADAYPVLDNTHETVYCGYEECKSVYANSEAELSKDPVAHTWSKGVCSVCNTKCTHNWSGYVCTICKMTCEQHDWENGTCSICSKVCGHDDYTNGFCTECGLYESAKTVSETHYPELNETHSGYYAIENAGQLYWFAEQVNNSGNANINAVLTADIIVNDGVFSIDGNYNPLYNGEAIDGTNSPRVWTPIGNDSNKYIGKFDGNNHTVSGLYYKNNGENYVGFFRYGAPNAEIKNVGIVNSFFYGGNYVGGVCGFVKTTKIISNCYNAGIIRGCDYIGGVCGYVEVGKIENSYNTGNVSGNDRVGGVCGHAGWSAGIIVSCYNMGSVSGSKYVGGVCGYNYDGNEVKNSYNTGSVSGTDYVGGICGKNYLGTITNCYYYSDNSINNIGHNEGGTATYVEGKTTEQFASGEVAYLLNGTVTDGAWAAGVTDGTQSWYQNLSGTAADACPVLNSGHGTVYKVEKYACTNPEELLGEGYSNTYCENDKLIVHTDEDNDGYCDISTCSESNKIADPIGVHLAGYSLSLSGNIGVNFYMALDESVLDDDTAYMQFTLPNKAEPVEVMVSSVKDLSVNVSGKDYYVFTCEVAAKEMADTITAQMFCSKGAGAVYEYSVKEYAHALITRQGATEEEIALAKAMLNYGAYAQTYFEYNTDNLANADYVDSTLEVTTSALKDYVPTVSDNSEIFDYAGSTLILESQIKVRHYFKLNENQTYSGSLTLYEAPENVTVEGTYYYYESEPVAAAKLGELTAYTDVSDITVNYCPLSYVTTVVATKDAALKEEAELQNLMKALYLYYEAVVAYNN